MEMETIVEGPVFQEKFQENAVQEILNDSVQVEISQSSESSTRLYFQLQGNLSELTGNLILSSASSVTPTILEALNISCVVNAAPELPDTPLHNRDVIYHKISILDSGNTRILPYFDEAADVIHKVANSGCRTLVYCVAGVSRSASICIAYIMKHHHMSLLEAYNYVKSRRPKIKPNCGFFKQLIEYEKILYGCNSVHMVFNEFVQMEIPDVYDCEYKFISHYSKKREQNSRH